MSLLDGYSFVVCIDAHCTVQLFFLVVVVVVVVVVWQMK